MASDMVPGFEVKLLLNPSEVLSSDGKLKSDVSAAFNISESTKKMNIQLLDTVEKDINNNGWNLRIRKKESANKFELTYKKRYEVNEEYPATDEEKINAVLNTAKRDGFDSTMPYEVEVELGYQKKTLSISRDEKIPDSGFSELELPKEHKSREVLIEKAPDMFKDWKGQNWGTQLLEKSIIYGPVLAKRSRGIFDGLTLSIEVWSMRKSKEDETLVPIVEASFKTPDLIQALGGRAKLQAFLNDNNWFLPEDSLRTKLIMERSPYEGVCSGSMFIIGVTVVEKRRYHPQVFKSAKIPWDVFRRLPNCYDAIQYAEATLHERIQSHFYSGCDCEGYVLFSAGETLLNGAGNLKLVIPDNTTTLVPCNSPVTSWATPDISWPIMSNPHEMGHGETVGKRRRLNRDLASEI